MNTDHDGTLYLSGDTVYSTTEMYDEYSLMERVWAAESEFSQGIMRVGDHEKGMNKVRWMMNRPDDYSCIHQNIAKSHSVTVYSTHWPCVHWWSNIDCLTWFWKTSHDRCIWWLTADSCEEFTVIVVTFRLLSMVKNRTIKQTILFINVNKINI